MKVLHIIQRYPPAIGGSEIWCSNISKFLADKGVISKVATINLYDMEEFQRQLPLDKKYISLGKYDYDEGVFINRYKLWTLYPEKLSTKIINFLLNSLGISRTELGNIFQHSPHSFQMYFSLCNEIKKTDVVHLHTLPFFHNIIGYYIARKLRKKIVITPYFHPHHEHYEKKMFFDIMRKSDAVIALSKYEKDYLTKKGIDPGKIYITGCFYRERTYEKREDFNSLRQRLFKKYGICENSKKIIFVGIKLFYKGVDILIEAAKEIANEEDTDLFLFLVGTDTAEFQNKYPVLDSFGRLRVINFSTATDEQKDNLLRFSDVLVLPSKFESFGIVFLEAWRYGKPVIGSDRGAIPEIIDGAGLCAKYRDVRDLKDKIKTVLFNRTLANKLGNTGKKKVKEQYYQERISNKVLYIYYSIRKNKRRVLIVSHLFPPYALGGSGIVAYEQSKMLERMGFEIKVFAGRLDNRQRHFAISREKTKFEITHINLHSDDFLHDDFDNLNKDVVQEKFREVLYDVGPDVVHFHNIYGLSPKMIDECHKMHIPMLMTLHDYWAICFKNLLLDNLGCLCDREDGICSSCKPRQKAGITNRFSACERNYLIMQCLKKVNLLISPSSYMAEKFINRGFPQYKIKVINNGIDISRFQDIKKTKTTKLRLGYIGQIIEHKGIENLLVSISLLDDNEKSRISLLIVGSGEDIYVNYCKDLAKQLELMDVVHFYGYIGNSKINKIYRNIDVLIVPSIWPENSPVAIMEALATGIPVLASDIGGIPELIQDDVNGYLHKHDEPISLTKNIRKIIEHPEILKTMGEACVLKARERDLTNQVKIIANEYRRIIGGN